MRLRGTFDPNFSGVINYGDYTPTSIPATGVSWDDAGIVAPPTDTQSNNFDILGTLSNLFKTGVQAYGTFTSQDNQFALDKAKIDAQVAQTNAQADLARQNAQYQFDLMKSRTVQPPILNVMGGINPLVIYGAIGLGVLYLFRKKL